MQGAETIIVGGGMAGLGCAVALEAAQHDWMLFEAADVLGGRVATAEVDGFCLDAGFQVLLTAYPEAQYFFDYQALQLGHYDPAARVWLGEGRWATVGDPLRAPRYLWSTMTAPVGNLGDKLRVAAWQRAAKGRDLREIWQMPDIPAREALREKGFSARMISRFWEPYFGGIFLETALATSRRHLEFVFQMFNAGTAALPRGGIAALPRQLAQRLPTNRLRTGQPVAQVEPGRVQLAGGRTIEARRVVLAVDGDAAAQLLGDEALKPPAWHATQCHYFAVPAAEMPVRRPLLHLNGSGLGVVQNLSFPSLAQPHYAPPGQHLLSVTTLSPTDPATVRAELATWWGARARAWRHLRSVDIPAALPDRQGLEPVELPAIRAPGLWLIGDYRGLPSLDSALGQGRRVAEKILTGQTEPNGYGR